MTDQIILNMDINKTIILSDAVQGLTMHDTINKKFAESKLVNDTQTYSDFIKEQIENVTLDDKDFERQVNGELKHLRDRLFFTFTNQGHPGEGHQEEFQKCLEQSKNDTKHGFTITRWFLLLITKLQTSNVNFKLVFRTFGTDGDDIIKEWNRICEGQHPDFPNLKDDKLKVKSKGCFHRTGAHGIETHGTETHGTEHYTTHLMLDDNTDPDHLAGNYITGLPKITEFIKSQDGNMLIRDHYKYWNDSYRQYEYGKPVYLTDGVDQYFFDDNINLSDSNEGIVNMQPKRDTNYLFEVDILVALLNPEKYVDDIIRKIEENNADRS
jgi:hypothetical protein